MNKIIVIILTLLLTACNTTTMSQPSEEALRFGMNGSIEHFNPVLTENGHSELISLVYRGLMKQNEENEVVGDLAEAYLVSEDELRYSFQLKEAYWHDGIRITADDIEFTIKQILAPENASPYYSDFQTVEKVEVINDDELHIVVSEPTPTLLNKLKVGIIPKHIYEHESLLTAQANTQPIGNGPYKLLSWSADAVLTFEVNEQYYGQMPSIAQIIVYTRLDENMKLLRLKAGDLHVAQITPKQIESLEAVKHLQVKTIETADYRALQFNQQHEQLQDPSVRLAVNYLIDREQLQNIVLHGTGELAYGPLQRSFARYDATVYAKDIEKGKELLQQAGYEKLHRYYEKDGQNLSFTIVAPVTDPTRVELATLIVEQLNAQGVQAKLQTKDWNNIAIEREDAFMIGWGSEDDPDTHTYRVFHSSEHAPKGYNYALVDHAAIDQALTAAKVGNEDERTQHYIEFQQLLAQEMAFSFLVYLDGIYAVHQDLQGITEKTLGHSGFGLFWNIEYWEWEDGNV